MRHRGLKFLHSHQAAQTPRQAAASAGYGSTVVHQPAHGLDALVHGQQLGQDLHICRTKPPLWEEQNVTKCNMFIRELEILNGADKHGFLSGATPGIKSLWPLQYSEAKQQDWGQKVWKEWRWRGKEEGEECGGGAAVTVNKNEQPKWLWVVLSFKDKNTQRAVMEQVVQVLQKREKMNRFAGLHALGLW